MEKRIDWIDCAKGFGILCVIIGHTPISKDLHNFIYSFHMPLFFLLSGFFFLKKQHTWREEFKNKFKTLIVPFVIFNLITFCFYKMLVPVLNGKDIDVSSFGTLCLGMITGNRVTTWLWFILVLFLAEQLIYIIFWKRTHIWLKTFAVAALGCIVNYYVKEPQLMCIDNLLIPASFIMFGIAIREHKLNYNKKYNFLILVIFVVFAYLSIKSTGNKGIEMYADRYGNYLYFYISSVAAIILIINAFIKLPSSRILIFLGKNSLIIYCVHKMLMRLIIITLDKSGYVVGTGRIDSFIYCMILIVGMLVLSVPVCYVVNKFTPFITGKK